MTLTVIALVLLALLGTPLFVILGAGALIAAYNIELDPAVLVIEIHRLASSPNLIAIPLFTLAGVALSRGGGPQRLVRLFNTLLGWMPGGLAVVSITTCAFFTAFSGASGITILAIGGLLYPRLTADHYGERFSLGLLTTSGSLGLLFPPSLAILLYGVVAGVGIEELFLAGMLPGLLLMIMLVLYSLARGKSRSAPSYPASTHSLGTTLRKGIWDLLLPPGILVGIFSGLVTVTEAAACTAFYVLIVECAVHRSLSLRQQLPAVLAETAVLVGSILIIVGMAMALTNLLIDAEIPMHLLEFLERHVDSKLQFLLLLNLFLLVVGCAMDIFSAIVVIAPLILPVAVRYNIDPVHLGIIFLANLELGYSTPPVGMNLFIASQRFGKPVLTLFRAALPFLGLMVIWLMMVTYVPALSLWWQAFGLFR